MRNALNKFGKVEQDLTKLVRLVFQLYLFHQSKNKTLLMNLKMLQNSDY